MPTVPKTQSQCYKTLQLLIVKGSATSIELRNKTSSSYPPARIRNLKKLGVSIHHTTEEYILKDGKKTHISRYMLMNPKAEARKILKRMAV